MSGKKRPDIQILRAISVLFVLVFHIRSQLLPNGYLGVDIFFFITGFVLFPQIEEFVNSTPGQRLNSFRNFLNKRFKRLMPAFLVSTIISITLLMLFASLIDHRSISLQSTASLLFLGNLSAENLIGNYFSPRPNPFLHYWSLSSEWQLYLLVPIIIAMVQRNFKITLIKVSHIYLILFFTVWALFLNSTSLFNYYSPISRVWEFFLGLCLAQRIQKMEEFQSHWIKLTARIVFFIVFVLVISPLAIETYYGQITSGVLFVSFILSRFIIKNYFRNLLLWIGERSYSIYLYHLPLVYLSLHSPLGASNFSLRVIGTILSVLITFLLAHWSYTNVEVGQNITVRGSSLDRLLGTKASIKLYVICLSVSLSLLVISSVFYGPYQGSRVDVAWKRFPKCPDTVVAPCIVSKNVTDKRIVWVGDSHTDHFLGVMRELSTSTNSNIYQLRERIDNYSQSASLQESLNQINPDLVIVSQFNTDPLLKDDFSKSLKLLRHRGFKVLFLADNPYFSDYLHYIHYVNPSITSLILSDPPPSEVSSLDLEKNSRLAPVRYLDVVKSLNVDYLDLYEYFCPENLCIRKIDGRYLFYDNHHLSIAGAALVQDDLIEIARRLLGSA